mmetsp:Transcript_34442/g.69575  ORF Transcript_34442/g.69575 Transcript_34442/m.69575 type:complete len:176 (-) Transcript_34442:254-781(-)
MAQPADINLVVGEVVEVKDQGPSADKCEAAPSSTQCAYYWLLYLGNALFAITAFGVSTEVLVVAVAADASLKLLRLMRLVSAILVLVMTILLVRLMRAERLPKGPECCCSCGCAFLPIGLGVLSVLGLVNCSIHFFEEPSQDVFGFVPGVFLLWQLILSMVWLRGLLKRRQGLCH